MRIAAFAFTMRAICSDRRGRAPPAAARAGDINGLHLHVFRDRLAVLKGHAAEAAGLQQVLERLRMNRLDVREVADVAAEERQPARRVDGFDDDRRAGPELLKGGAEEPRQIGRRQMFHDLRGHQAAQRSVGKRLEVRQGISLDDVQAALAGGGDHFLVGVDAAGRDAGGLQEREKLPAPAADVEHVARAGKQRHVGPQLLANLIV